MSHSELHGSNIYYKTGVEYKQNNEIEHASHDNVGVNGYEELTGSQYCSEDIDKMTAMSLNENNMQNGSNVLINENDYLKENEINKRKTHGGSYPRQVMTPLGPLPLPDEFKKNIPEKFVAKPIIEEREIYVSKKERKQREIELPHVKYEHKFEKIKKQFKISKLIPSVSQVIKEVPKEVLKPVIEEKIIEVPQGVKYVEVPVEVPCLYPPKIVPKVVTQYVERIVETIKPVVQEKIIEVPQTVIKQVPKIKTVEVPYYVPRYVEKIVEVPFKPNGEMPKIGSYAPFSISESLPPLKPFNYLNNSNNPNGQFDAHHSMFPKINNFNNSLEPDIMNTNVSAMHNSNVLPAASKTLDPSSFLNYNKNETLYDQIKNLSLTHKLPEGLEWKYPEGILNNPMVNNKGVPPLVVTCPPEIGKVTCANADMHPDILTKKGVYEFGDFKKKGTSKSLFPPLAHHDQVPFLPSPAPPGTPDIRVIQSKH